MSKSFRAAVIPVIFSAVLSACGSGGGGADRGSVVGEGPLPPQPPRTVVMQGISVSGSQAESGFNVGNVDGAESTTTLTYDSRGNLRGAGISTPQAAFSFGANEISESPATGQRTSHVGANTEYIAVLPDPVARGWNYQSFGVWFSNIDTTPFQAGAMSFGAVTPGSAVPTTSSATFSGHAGGFYFDAAGNRFVTDAQMNAITDFKNRNIQFSTTGTLLTDMNTGARSGRSGLDLRGDLSYEAGFSQFTGNVNTVNNELTGNASGRFYGPNAEEIGGVYGLTGNGASMLGGFGGKR